LASRELICNPNFYQRDYPVTSDVFCFVIMPFGDPLLQEVYQAYIKPTIESLGIKCVRGDDIFSTGSIMEDIWSSLCRCAFVVGEFTGRNPNVLYEAGITHTLGKPLIGLTQVVDDIPFDFRHIRVINYSNSPSGYRELEKRLSGTVQSLMQSDQVVTPRSLAEMENRVEYLAQMITDERSRNQQLYIAIENRQRQQLDYLQARLKDAGVGSKTFTPIELCDISSTMVTIDSWDEEEQKVVEGDEIAVSSFSMAKYPVTNSQYLEFLLDTGYYPPEHWKGGTPPMRMEKFPVVGVSWNDTESYCRWLSGKMNAEVRMPTEAEWLAAAGYGEDHRRYPWGDSWLPNACNSKEYGTNKHTPVDKFEAVGVSPAGCVDLLGNVWEWTASSYDQDGGFNWRAVRGGANYTPLKDSGCLARLVAYPGHFLFVRDLGLRVAVRLKIPSLFLAPCPQRGSREPSCVGCTALSIVAVILTGFRPCRR
jgi:hypothetical protein